MKKLLVKSALLCLAQAVSAQYDTTVTEHQCVSHSPLNQRLSHLAADSDFQPDLSDPSLYTDNLVQQSIVIDVRETPVGQNYFSAQLNGALKIPRYLIKTKNYLKDKKITLIGDGLDNYSLEKYARELKNNGFKSVWILNGGMPDLTGHKDFMGNKLSLFDLHRVSYRQLTTVITGAQQRKNRILFVNLSDPDPVFEQLNLWHISYAYTPGKAFIKKLNGLLVTALLSHPRAKILLVYADNTVYRALFSARDTMDIQRLWFVQGGVRSLVRWQKNHADIPAARKRVKGSCLL